LEDIEDKADPSSHTGESKNTISSAGKDEGNSLVDESEEEEKARKKPVKEQSAAKRIRVIFYCTSGRDLFISHVGFVGSQFERIQKLKNPPRFDNQVPILKDVFAK